MKRILLTGPEVREVLETGRVVVRRVVKPQPHMYEPGQDDGLSDYICDNLKCPLGKSGDKVWVGETFCVVDDSDFGEAIWIDYRATPRYSSQHPAGWENEPDNPEALKWQASTSMPQEHSRLTLEIVSVKIEHHDKWEWVWELKRIEKPEETK